MMKVFASRQFILFLVTGGMAAVVNFGSRIIYNQWMSFSTAVILSYITGMITAYVLARLFVFKESQQAVHRSMLFFILVNAVAILQTWGISLFLLFYVFPAMKISAYSKEFAHAIGVLVPVFTSYVGHKRWSFK
ncbi:MULTISPECIES: GtrA family protein [unclassified Janthinobacterium]|uniref:GtrA family protein n=1 Tax=unclassified Janthinobacterium TaxID=2610881 RepID=UPI000AC729A8|nr:MULTISPECIES: GtrA family protein [unclassified Janthinobacterium]